MQSRSGRPMRKVLLLGAAVGGLLSAPAYAQQTPTTGDAVMDSFGLTAQNERKTQGNTDAQAAAPVVSRRGDTTFLMSAFDATSQDRMSLYQSYDGIEFTTLNMDAYKPAKGLLRDPSLLHAADGYYYIVYTTAWDGNRMGVARSRDLKTWDHVGDAEVTLPGVTNTWAPEWYRDKDGSIYVVVSLSKGGTKGPFGAHLIKAVDLATAKFDTPVPMEGLQGNYIDTFTIPWGETYVAVTKNETTKTLELVSADKLTGPWKVLRRGNWAGWGDWIEGPALVSIKDKDGKPGFRIYFDDYLTKRYWYSDSYDWLKTWTPRQELGGVSGAVRHFTVLSEPTATVEAATAPSVKGKQITWDKHSLMIDGERTMVWAGEFHPFRLPSPSLWRDVLQKMKASGFNTVALYMDWGYHSSMPGQYDFSGVRDIERAIEMAEELDMYVIIRPGPYVNAELTMGGFPGYLARQKALARTDDPEYLKDVDQWMTQINAIVERHQITNGGGKVILYQIENELGLTTPTHQRYMQHLYDKAKADGITVPIFHNAQSRLPNWTPKNSSTPWSVPGPVDIYAFDGYPGGGCTNTHDIGKPNKVPNWGMYAEIPEGATAPDPKNPVKIGALTSPNTPGFAAEIGSGWFDFWGSIGSYDCTSKRIGSEYVKTFFGSSLINGLSIHSIYMAFGGTSWGWTPASVVYTSYDYGAGIDEARGLRDKQYTLKQMGQFVQAAEPLLGAMDKAEVLTSSSPKVKLYHNRSPQEHGDLIFAIHEPTDEFGDNPFSFDLTTRDGTFRVPQQGTLRLNGQDAKLLVADYALERQHVVYSTSQLQTHLRQGDRDIALFYGPRGEDGETVLRFAKKPKVTILSGNVTNVWDAKTKTLRLNYVHAAMNRVRIETAPNERLELLLAEDEVAKTFWRQDTPDGPVLERSNALIRTAKFDNGALHLTGDTEKESTIEIWAPKPVQTLTFNGQPAQFEVMEGALWTTGLAGPQEASVPNLMELQWVRRKDSQEADPKFDDSQWRVADLKESAATLDTQPPPGAPVLAMSDYGFHHGDVWYRGKFRVTGQSPETLNFTWNGGPAGVAQVWIDGRFIGEREGTAGEARPKTTMKSHLYIPALRPGEHTVSIMVRNNAHNWDLGADDEHKEARGLISVELGKLRINWKIQGNKGGEFISDLVRGPMNNGGLYGEREGWYLPVAPFADTTGWEAGTFDDDPPGPGTYWLRTNFKLDLPKDHDTQIGLVFGDPDVPRTVNRTRILIFVNGWHVGNFLSHIGPQKTFILPPGILNANGDNTLTFAVTTDGKPQNAPEPVKLVVLRNVRGGVPVEPVPQPSKNQR
ncbi:beta-galactosidase [Asticcacaulis sp. AC460]|uniref:beta-galactosidase n=1 Tax=Asticcacaulis sp. AC460 TaxID=1282360 RepID=UPI0004CF5868|nr:beta-galactosidase [Asticcacaulis sp. AC460]